MIEGAIQEYAVEDKSTLRGKTIYALVVTFVGVLLVYVLKRTQVI